VPLLPFTAISATIIDEYYAAIRWLSSAISLSFHASMMIDTLSSFQTPFHFRFSSIEAYCRSLLLIFFIIFAIAHYYVASAGFFAVLLFSPPR